MNTMNLISNGQSYSVSRFEAGVYRVMTGERLLGFVERVGSIYVALSGTRYDRAVEAGQAHSLAQAASLLERPSERSTAERMRAVA